MTDEKDNPIARKTPPDSEKEWQFMWDGISKSHKSWTVTGPIYAIVVNWRALVVIFLAIAWINSPKIAAAIALIAGTDQ